ncbi:MAG: ribose ABC transporter permease [Armatimonadota bacterium]|nr:ribose ABC transporter permease [Armatimonadota bacterium]
MRSRMFQTWQQFGMTGVLIVMCIFLSVAAPNFSTTGNLVNIARQVSINAILAAGMTVVILTGGIDLSVGSALAVTGVASVWLEVHHANSLEAVLGAVAVGAMIGGFNGLLIARVKLQPFIVTLGALTYLRGMAYVATGAYPLIKTDLGFAFLGIGALGPVPWPVVIACLVFLTFYLVLKLTIFGRHVYAIGDNEQSSRLSGINVSRTLIWVYVISGICSGIAGVIYSARLASGQPQGGQGYELDAIAAVILGGTSLTGGVGSILGTLIGALIIGVLDNGLILMNVPFFYQLIIKGGVIIAAVLLDRLRSSRAAG